MYLVKQVLAQCSNSSENDKRSWSIYWKIESPELEMTDWDTSHHESMIFSVKRNKKALLVRPVIHHIVMSFYAVISDMLIIYVRYVPALLFHNLKQIKKGGSLLKGHTPLLIGIISCAQQEINEECTKILLC